MTFDDLVEHSLALASSGSRQLLGIVGAPGAGKSTLAARVVDAVNVADVSVASAIAVPMDGFHLAQRELERLGRTERKGAIDTFDGAGFVAMARRLASAEEPVVYAPAFERSIEEPIAGAIPIPQETPLVILEGNYLLADQAPWHSIRGLLAESWFIELADDVRLPRLIERHQRFGRTRAEAEAHARGSDQINAELVAHTASNATYLLTGN